MLRSSLIAASSVILCASASAQQGATVQPLPTAVKDAGIYHVATGTWTRNSSATANLGPDTIYRNDANSGYFTTLNMAVATEDYSVIDAGRIPTSAGTVPGTDRIKYTVNCIELAYCSGVVGPNVAITFNAYESYSPCDLILSAPAAPFTLAGSVSATGLPGGTASGAACWIATIDFSGGGEFCLEGDGGADNPGEDLDTTTDSFGLEWTFNGAFGTSTGPLLSGDPTWSPVAMGSITGVGGGGTYYSAGFDACGTATGLDTEDFFAVDGSVTPLGQGCYFFGGYKNTNGCGLASNTPLGSFHQVLFADTGECVDTGGSFCDPAGVNADGNMAALSIVADGAAGSGMTLNCSGGTVGQAGIVIVSDANQGNAAISNGTLCLQGFGRYNGFSGMDSQSIGVFDAAGDFSALGGNGDANGLGFRIPSTMPAPYGGTISGATWHFQLWYRDNPALGEYNFSNGVSNAF
ncbi:MAG: hypothetical protein ACI9HE_000092 [Planctomycetota bacterium]|jgi:hypothetical protein